MKPQSVLLGFIIVGTSILMLWLATDTEVEGEVQVRLARNAVVESALSRTAKAVRYLDVASRLCDHLCIAVPKPAFCNRWRFSQTHGVARFDFSQLPEDDVPRGSDGRIDVVYSATGERFYGPGGQSYVFDSIRQWRLFHSPRESRVFIVVDDDRMADPNLKAAQRELDIIAVSSSSVATPRLKRYRKFFYIQGYMHPGGNRTTGNKDFNQLVMERFILIAAVMRRFQLSHILHLENDNMIYANMRAIVRAVARCRYGLATTAPSAAGFVAGVIYVKDAESLEHFVDFVNDLLSCGKSFGLAMGQKITGEKNAYANDMTYLMNYYQLFGSAYIGELPSRVHAEGENCIVVSSKQLGLTPYLFDAVSFGQWYSFAALENSSAPPARVQRSVRKRYLDVTPPPYLRWEVATEGGKRIPLWKNFRIVSLHIHAKNLRVFASR